ncbi:MAG: DUF1361 domain-containing protein [Actinobacteria bacterium]|nr:MAG: DUF1361 domain-containing protein [Actinomycetota bacterium]TML85655.1 MAG: DUF1361 domain-containing protein [Actinomycetota bacterium]
MRSSRRRLATILALFAASLFCVALVVVRNVHTGNVDLRYLIWNLFLAWIPFALAVFVYDRWRRCRAGPLLFVLGVLWLLFFPNAPYIATDFVHLEHDPLIPYWYDAVTIAAFAWIGVLLGFASLYLMQTVVRQWRGAVAGWIFAFAAIGLGSLGIYLGRFLRLNSWDAVEHPSVLPRILHAVARDPFAYQEAIAVTVLFTAALSFAYFLLYNVAAGGLDLDAER